MAYPRPHNDTKPTKPFTLALGNPIDLPQDFFFSTFQCLRFVQTITPVRSSQPYPSSSFLLPHRPPPPRLPRAAAIPPAARGCLLPAASAAARMAAEPRSACRMLPRRACCACCRCAHAAARLDWVCGRCSTAPARLRRSATAGAGEEGGDRRFFS